MGEVQKGAFTLKVLVCKKVDQIMMVVVFLFNNEYLYYDLMIGVLLNFSKCIHASLGRSRCKC